MLAEKLDRLDDMEQLLRRVMRDPARLPPRLQRARLLARRTQPAAGGSAHADPQGARAQARRALHHRQPGLGRVPAGQPRGSGAPAAPGLPVAARRRDRRPPGRSAVGQRAARRGAAHPARRAQPRRRQRRAARNAGAAASRPVNRPAGARRGARSPALGCAGAGCRGRAVRLRDRCASPASTALAGRLSVRVEAHPASRRARSARASSCSATPSAAASTCRRRSGTVLAQARWSPGQVLLVTPQGRTPYADLTALTRDLLGEPLAGGGALRLAARPALARRREQRQPAARRSGLSCNSAGRSRWHASTKASSPHAAPDRRW